MATPPAYPWAEGTMDESDLRDQLLADEPPADLGAMSARAWSAVAPDPGPLGRLRRLSTPARAALVLAVAGMVVAANAAGTPRPDLSAYPLFRLGLQGAVMSAGAVAGLWLAMRPTWRPEPARWVAGTVLALALALPMLGALLTAPATDYPGSLLGAAFVPATTACFVYGTACAAVVAISWRAVEQRRVVGPWRWATAAAAGAGVANLALLLHCPATDLGHQALGHGAVGLVGAAAAALAAWATDR